MKILACLFVLSVILFSCSEELVPDRKDDLQQNEIIVREHDTIPYEYFYSIDFDENNDLWMQTMIEDTSVHLPPYSSYLPMKSLLIKYDGEIYTVYDGLLFAEMFFDANDNLWLHSGSQLMTFDRYKNQIEVHYMVEDEESYIEKVYLDSQNNNWIEGSKNIGLLKQTKNGWEKQFSPTEYYKLHIDKNGDTYFSTLENSVVKYSDGKAKIVGEESWEENFVLERRGLLTDDNNRLWVSAVGSNSLKISLAVFEDGAWKANNPPIDNEGEIHSLETMFLDKNGRLWVQNNKILNNKIEGNALFVFDNETWSLYEHITDDHIYDYAFDQNDNLWLTTYKKGIIKIDF